MYGAGCSYVHAKFTTGAVVTAMRQMQLGGSIVRVFGETTMVCKISCSLVPSEEYGLLQL